MRGNDPQDMEDIAFLARQGSVTPETMEAALPAFASPDVQELRDALERALPVVREIVLGRKC